MSEQSNSNVGVNKRDKIKLQKQKNVKHKIHSKDHTVWWSTIALFTSSEKVLRTEVKNIIQQNQENLSRLYKVAIQESTIYQEFI